MLVWAFAATEVVSALARKRREAAIRQETFSIAKRRLGKLEKAWNEVVEYEAVRARARRLLELHALRAADALHLGAALVAAEEDPGRMGFVTFDGRLAEAAEKEGFRVFCA
jgi:predicted nucleic acid-binding protein